MNLPKNFKEILLSDFETILKQMDESISIEEKLYFFSAVHGTLNRVMNICCDPLLVFSHQVMQGIHLSFTNRLNQRITPSNMSFMGLPSAFMDALINNLKEFVAAFESDNDENIRLALQKMATLTYAATGNGFYLFTSGKLKIA
jgi:hypothetical protein